MVRSFQATSKVVQNNEPVLQMIWEEMNEYFYISTVRFLAVQTCHSLHLRHFLSFVTDLKPFEKVMLN